MTSETSVKVDTHTDMFTTFHYDPNCETYIVVYPYNLIGGKGVGTLYASSKQIEKAHDHNATLLQMKIGEAMENLLLGKKHD